MSKIFKKNILNVVAIILIVCTFTLFAVSSTDDEEPNDQGTGVADSDSSNSNLGDYLVEIKSCRLAKDYEGQPIVIVNYAFTNNSDDPAAFSVTFSANVYQNGIGLNECYFTDESANYSADNQSKEIKKGATLEVEVAYTLNDTTSDIEVEVEEWISFSDNKVVKTFKIAE